VLRISIPPSGLARSCRWVAKVLALAAREAQIIGINGTLRSGDATSRDSTQSWTAAATDQKLRWVRDAAGARFDDLEIQTIVGVSSANDEQSGCCSS
jgi:hypothetical protein